MKQLYIATTLSSLIIFSVTGCASTSEAPAQAQVQPQAKAVAVAAAQPQTPALSAEASQALAQAEAAVKDAKAKYALWIPTESALKMAQEAAKAGDSDAVIKQAKVITEQVKTSLAQLNYPSTEMK